MNSCNTMVTIGYRKHDNSPIEVKCGTYVGGSKEFCDSCETELKVHYPQGWRGYPGDTCKHGVYVGGSGADYMCGYCEMGDDFEEDEEPSFPEGGPTSQS